MRSAFDSGRQWLFAIGLTVAFGAALGYVLLQGSIRDASALERQLARNVARILLLDETLTMSARMAAAARDPAYEHRYREHLDELDRLLDETLVLVIDEDVKTAVRSTEDANRRLVEVELRSFELDARGRYDDALASLEGAPYREDKAIYAAGMGRAFERLRQLTARRTKRTEWEARALGAGALLSLLFVFLGWKRQAAEFTAELAERERRLRAELETAATLQTSILPRSLEVEGVELAAEMRTATEVGGDYYDVLAVRDGCWLAIGDVSGHGLEAGVIMIMIQSAISALVRAMPDASPREVECLVNEVIFDNVRTRMKRREHATLTILRYDRSGRVRIAGAHEDILVWRASTSSVDRIATSGTWVGARRDILAVTQEDTFDLGPGDVMLLYTDGVTEAFRGREQFGIDRLADTLAATGTRSVEEIRDAITTASREWSAGTPVVDDSSLVVLRHLGPRSGTVSLEGDGPRERCAV